MKIIVVGCGKIGTTIIDSLVQEGHDVVAVDDDRKAIDELNNIYDIMCVCGNGTDCEVLSEAGVESTELICAVTGSDELNMLCCFLARRMGAHHTIARIRNPEYNDTSLGFMKQQLDLSMAINPELLAAQELYNILKLPEVLNIDSFSRRNFEMVELQVREGSVLDGIRLADLRRQYPGSYLVCAVQRNETVSIPDGNFTLQAGDLIGLTADAASLPKLFRTLGLVHRQAKSVMILGASKTAYYLCRMLTAGGSSVKVIELDRQRCLDFSDEIPQATIIHGDGASQELLLEEGIRDTDAFVSLTGMDEENILISCYAASQKVPKVITKVNRLELASMAQKLGLDCIVSPRRIISDVLVRYARALNNSIGSKMESMYKLMDGQTEALEFVVGDDFRHCSVPLRDMKWKPNTIIAGIIRGRKPFIPTGDDMILPGDHVIAVTAGWQARSLAEMIK